MQLTAYSSLNLLKFGARIGSAEQQPFPLTKFVQNRLWTDPFILHSAALTDANVSRSILEAALGHH